MRTPKLASAAAAVKPSGIYAYIDVVRIWMKTPLPPHLFDWLDRHCDGGARAPDWPCRFDWHYRQCLHLYQPDREALAFLARRNGVRLTYVEASLDWVFAFLDQCEDAYAVLDRHHVKNHQRDGLRYKKGTRYAGRRTSPNTLVIYADRHSKATGEIHCVHLDWRLRGRALQQAGITSVADLLDFDHHRFWRDRLTLYAIDVRKLGRAYWRHQHGTRRQRWVKTWLGGKIRLDVFGRIGLCIIARLAVAHHNTVQEALRRYPDLRLREHGLVMIPIDHLLPGAHSIYDYGAISPKIWESLSFQGTYSATDPKRLAICPESRPVGGVGIAEPSLSPMLGMESSDWIPPFTPFSHLQESSP
jgi:hypothetical protein